MPSRWTLGANALLIGALAATAAAGPEWVENDNVGGAGQDAGATPDGAMPTEGSGDLNAIRGRLTGAASSTSGPLGDVQDVYVICISDPGAFMASTATGGGFAEFDSRLFLFDVEGFGILGNLVATGLPAAPAGGFSGATLGNMATDGSGAAVNLTGLYLLAITTPPFVPQCEGEDIFDFVIPGEVSGPDGAGGDCPLDEWQPEAPPTGACCLDGDCLEATESECAIELGGSYQGDGSTCDDEGVDCAAELLGACCFSVIGVGDVLFVCENGLSEIECLEEFGGTFFGPGSVCDGDGVECPPPALGACCLFGKEFQCIDGTTQAECEIDLEGLYWGDGTLCGKGACTAATGGRSGSPPDPGALQPGPAWTPGGGGADAPAPGITPENDGDYVIILNGVCFANEVPVGACEQPDGTCVDGVTEYACVNGGGSWLGPDSSCTITASVQFKKEACPAPMNPTSNGIMKVMLAGDDAIDIAEVDLSTLRLIRADGVGGEVAPNDGPPGPTIMVKDEVAPLYAPGGCNCDLESGGDGVDDLEIPFRADDIAEALGLGDVPAGETVDLVLVGALLDGTPLAGGDCIRIVGPGPGSVPLTVADQASGAWIEVGPLDAAFDGGGFADFVRWHEPGGVVWVLAPPSAGDAVLVAWRIDGELVPFRSPIIAVTVLDSGRTVEPVYGTPDAGDEITPAAARRGDGAEAMGGR